MNRVRTNEQATNAVRRCDEPMSSARSKLQSVKLHASVDSSSSDASSNRHRVKCSRRSDSCRRSVPTKSSSAISAPAATSSANQAGSAAPVADG